MKKTNNQNYHGMTWSSMWIIHKEMVARAMREVRKQIWNFTIYDKENENKEGDLVTTADYAAQQIYTNMMAECTPNAGIVAEENGLKKDPINGETIIYTIDPVDGTKALVRRQSDGIGTLLGVVDSTHKQIIASYIWDIMTNELYYYRPWSDVVHRLNIANPEQNSILSYQNRIKKRILTLDDVRKFPKWTDNITQSNGYRDSIGTSNGSIGTNMAKLRKWEVDAVLLKPWVEHPRDRVPCAGISHKLWYLNIYIQDNIFQVLDMNESRYLTSTKVPHQLIVHKSELESVSKTLTESGLLAKGK